MYKSLITMLLIAVCLFETYAGVKEFTFSGTVIRFDDESHRIIVHNGKRELSFFILPDDFDNQKRPWDDFKNRSVTITYKKSKLLMANKIEIHEHIALHDSQSINDSQITTLQ